MDRKLETKLPKQEFKWDGGILFQKVEVIRHYPYNGKDVGVWSEWEKVTVEGKEVNKPSKYTAVNFISLLSFG